MTSRRYRHGRNAEKTTSRKGIAATYAVAAASIRRPCRITPSVVVTGSSMVWRKNQARKMSFPATKKPSHQRKYLRRKSRRGRMHKGKRELQTVRGGFPAIGSPLSLLTSSPFPLTLSPPARATSTSSPCFHLTPQPPLRKPERGSTLVTLPAPA